MISAIYSILDDGKFGRHTKKWWRSFMLSLLLIQS
ncbi:hypothetical protein CIPAW_10G051300 [Carya illinoinensis]|uniref:Uncharacterized protein n=1 Tax=Carya illinoinensis TaxID=32201 RepID=A0A8T1P940_CARIL|nr:hypothetical protein CIPAW_10G051300 [Carya illinoinensis]